MVFIRRFNIGMLFRAMVLEHLVRIVYRAVLDILEPNCELCDNSSDCSHKIRQIDVITHFSNIFETSVNIMAEAQVTHLFLRRAELSIQKTVTGRGQEVCYHCLRMELIPATLGNLVNDCRIMEEVFHRVLQKTTRSTSSEGYQLWSTNKVCQAAVDMGLGDVSWMQHLNFIFLFFLLY
jgi:hypothetical protein